MALKMALERLSGVALDERGRLLGLSFKPHADGFLFRAFGRDFCLTPGFDLLLAQTGEPAKSGDHILVLHYLDHFCPVKPEGRLISFTDLPGGQFYWKPFLSRTAIPLLRRIGNNEELLREALSRFDWEKVEWGDFGARVHALGPFHVTLAFHKGDDEFEPALDVLFDASVKQFFNTEDSAYLASRICLGLL